ncbi:DUF4442 domain-containing protein [Shewanella maritima]|uniref:DUF4442 domain-containing protein n=1 Tax=Shewanella maritima TaxID=2520507 RepID=UPI003736423D
MTIYQQVAKVGPKIFGRDTLFKYGFNWLPMYRRSTGRITKVSKDLHKVEMRLPISYRNRNYVGSIFGGSMFSAVDPIPMVQLINILDNQYIVWDKSAEIAFKAPAREELYADFVYTDSELQDIIERVESEKEINIIKLTQLTNKDKSKVYCEVSKTIYISTKQHYKLKRQQRAEQTQS